VSIERDDWRATLRLVAGDPLLLLLDETRYAPDPGRVRALGLSPREAEIVALAARGLGDVEIADTLVVGVRTVHKHLENVYRKLGVRTRREAAARLFDR
jgi:DNA-binding CsgD family transcriptional regulator